VEAGRGERQTEEESRPAHDNDEARYRAELAQRYRAELAFARERCEREAERQVERDRKKLLGELVGLVDDLERALEAVPDDDPLRAGVRLVRDRFLALLERHGVRRMETDAYFDPRLHDAVATLPVTSSDWDGRIVAVHAPGYAVGDDVLRPAGVVVGRYDPHAPQS
jgi:molecular chaperone GrpE